jgi:NAD(P)-dependent dehydrogenase (short-subunit alcohol dehydrogenase family)
MRDLRGAVSVVTGAGSGMGQQIAVQLAEQQASIAAVDISVERLAETVDLIHRAGGTCRPYVVDVADREQVVSLAKAVEVDLGPAAILVNNAGILMKSERFDVMPMDMIERLLDINLRGVISCTHEFLPQLLTHEHASLVNVSSLGGLVGLMKQVPYAAAKFGMRGFSEALRMDLYDTNVAITVVYPGPVATKIFVNSPALSREEGLAGQETMKKVHPMPVEKAGRLIVKGIRKGKPRVILGRDAKAMDILQRIAPNAYTKLLYRPVRKMMDATS